MEWREERNVIAGVFNSELKFSHWSKKKRAKNTSFTFATLLWKARNSKGTLPEFKKLPIQEFNKMVSDNLWRTPNRQGFWQHESLRVRCYSALHLSITYWLGQFQLWSFPQNIQYLLVSPTFYLIVDLVVKVKRVTVAPSTVLFTWQTVPETIFNECSPQMSTNNP